MIAETNLALCPAGTKAVMCVERFLAEREKDKNLLSPAGCVNLILDEVNGVPSASISDSGAFSFPGTADHNEHKHQELPISSPADPGGTGPFLVV